MANATRPTPHWHRCLTCNGLGRIDDDQLAGRISIICGHCGAHYTLPAQGI